MGTKAIYPGTFDPITKGHIDLAERAGTQFEEVVVAIAASPSKQPMFSLEERLDMASIALQHISNVTITGFQGLLIDCVRKADAQVVLRGLRAVSDFEYEFQLATMNKTLSPGLETMFMMTEKHNFYVSSKLVREVASLGGDVSELVPDHINKALQRKFNR